MELTFEKDELLHALQMVQGVASGRNTLPILSNVLIRAQDGNIELAATDLEVGIKIKVAGTITEEGTTTVSAKKLVDIVRELPDKTINMVTTANHRVELTCGDGVYKIIGLSDEDFPELPSADGEGVTIDGETLCSIIHKTEFAASREEFRYYLNGLYFNLLEDKTEVVGTDAIRHLALAHCASLKTSEDADGFIVPLKAVKEIERTFADSANVKILLIKNQILFANDNATLTTRLVEGDYPPYQSIIPESSEGRVVVSKEPFLRATRRVALLSDPKNFSICLEMDTEEIRISAQTPELGEAHETIAVESGTGSVRIGFDARVLTDILAHIEAESLILEFSGEVSPVLVKPAGDDEHICIIMPMRLETSLQSES
jgi:DNA polymerase-3 subunit beta